MDNREVKEELENTELENNAENAEKTDQPVKEDQAIPKDEINKLKEEIAASKDKYIRLYSEFENFRRRTAKEKLEMIQSANEQLIKSLLPVVDDFERAEKTLGETTDPAFEGFLLISTKLKKVLEVYSVKVMDIQKGTDFNADLHEAITQTPAPEPDLKGKIVEVIENGYRLNDKVIRYAKVVVGS